MPSPLNRSVSLWLVPLLILVVGTGSSWSLRSAFRQDAQRTWETEADQTAERLSFILLTWLEESYAPLSSLGMLAENSDNLTDVEFLNGMNGLEDRATAFFLDSAGYFRVVPGSGPELMFSTDTTGPLAPDAAPGDSEELRLAIEAALREPDRILMAPPIRNGADALITPVALSVFQQDGEPGIVAGLVNVEAMISGLHQQFVPAGMALELEGRFLGGDPLRIYNGVDEKSAHSATTRTMSAGADVAITWHFTDAFQGGPRARLAGFALLAGTTVSALAALFIGVLLRRNRVISLRIEEATEELAESRDAANEANKAKSAFLANMSHELRTPMNAIIGYSEMLMEEAEEQEDTAATDDLKKIHEAGTHLLALINDVLDISKIEAGKMEVYAETFDVASMIDSVKATTETLARKNNNRLHVHVDNAVGEMHSDSLKVRQALFNLLSNAAKFTHDGEIQLEVELERTSGIDWVRMSVADTGVGIPREKMDLIFREFSQADETTTRDYGGTGLGLSISRRFCQMLGGDITVVSKVGEGSTFTIRLPARLEQPLQDPTETPQTVADSVKHTATEPNILVIDDDPNAVDLLGRTLRGAGMRVVSANRGPQALELAQTLRPDAITLDVLMPGMDGWEVLRELKADPATQDIPVIMVTMTKDRELGYSLGATEYLTKPVKRDQLVQLLERHAPSGANNYALVVDDMPENRQVLRKTLEKEGWRVGEAENGKLALEQLATEAPALILLDLMMPVMDGFEFVFQVRQEERWRAIPIVVVTAKDLTDADRRRLNGDVSGLIERSGLDQEAFLAQLAEQLQAVHADHA